MSEDELARLRELRDFWYRVWKDDPARGEWAKANFNRVDAQLRELELENMARWRAEMISGRDTFPIPDAEDFPEVTGVPVSAPSPSASPFSLYGPFKQGDYEEVKRYFGEHTVTSVLGSGTPVTYRVPEKTEREQ